MTPPIRSAMGDALSLLKAGNVASATAAIQRSLGFGPTEDAAPQAPAGDGAGGFETPSQTLSAETVRLRLRQRALGRKPASRDVPVPAETFKPKTSGKTRIGKEDQRFSLRNVQGKFGSLDYKLYVPADHASRELALVMMLHGCTQDPDDFALGTRMNILADEFGLIVAYPHQPRKANAQGCWNWFDARHQQRGAGEPALLSAVAQDIAREFQIAPESTFVAGLSAGGAMADILAATYPDVFAGAGIHSGLPKGAANDLMSAFGAMKGKHAGSQKSAGIGAGPTPTVRKIIFHGSADSTVNASNGLEIFRRLCHHQRDGVEMTIDRTINGGRVTLTTLDRPDGIAQAEYWLMHDAGHAWSGGDKKGTYAEASGPDASREMIRFFLQK